MQLTTLRLLLKLKYSGKKYAKAVAADDLRLCHAISSHDTM